MSRALASNAAPAELVDGRRKGGAGSLVDHPQLTQLSAMLKAIDAGDRILKGRLELFYCSRRSLTLKAQQDLERRAPQSLTESPLGPLSADAPQNLLANLRALLALLFVDYDCTAIMPADFEHCADKHTVVATINHSLATVVDRVHSGFMSEFWETVQEAIDVVNCDVYAFRPKSGGFDPADRSLMSFHYFFINPTQARILFIGCVTKSRGAARGSVDSDSDMVLSQIDSDSSKPVSRAGSISNMGSSLQDGEYAFSDGGSGADEDGMLD